MVPYFLCAAALAALATLEIIYEKRERLWSSAALTLVLVFGAFRYQTGYDWPIYDHFFLQVPTLATAICEPWPFLDPPMEPLFLFAAVITKSLGGNVTLLIAIATAASIAIIHGVVQALCRSASLFWLIYFCVVFPAAQMSATRNAVAAALVLAALLLACRHRLVWATLVTASAVGFHYFSATFAPLLVLRNLRPPVWLAAATVAVGIIAALAKLEPMSLLATWLLAILPEEFSYKLAVYSAWPAVGISNATLALIAAHLGLLLYFYSRMGEQKTPVTIVAIWLTLLVLACHLLLWGYPIFWNRVMVVALPWQLGALFGSGGYVGLNRVRRLAIVLVLGVASFAALSYFMSKPESKMFLPYQSLFQLWLGDEGTGAQRAAEWEAYRQASERGRISDSISDARPRVPGAEKWWAKLICPAD